MRSMAHNGSQRALMIIAGGVAAVCVLSAAWAQFGNAGVARGFKVPEFYDQEPGQTNRPLKTLITGAEAQPNAAGSWAVKQMEIETYERSGDTNIIARAPECAVDPAKRVVWSTGRLEVKAANGQFLTEGNEGFFCRMSNTVLVLSNRVRTTINRQLVQPRTHENKTN